MQGLCRRRFFRMSITLPPDPRCVSEDVNGSFHSLDPRMCVPTRDGTLTHSRDHGWRGIRSKDLLFIGGTGSPRSEARERVPSSATRVCVTVQQNIIAACYSDETAAVLRCVRRTFLAKASLPLGRKRETVQHRGAAAGALIT